MTTAPYVVYSVFGCPQVTRLTDSLQAALEQARIPYTIVPPLED